MKITLNHPEPGQIIRHQDKNYEIVSYDLKVALIGLSTEITPFAELQPIDAQFLHDLDEAPITVNLDTWDYSVF